MKLLLTKDRHDPQTLYCDLRRKQEVGASLPEAITTAKQEGCQVIEFYRDAQRVATYRTDGSKLK